MSEDKENRSNIKLVSLETSTDKFNSEMRRSVTNALNEAVSMSENNEITGIVILATTVAGETHSLWSMQSDSHMMLAAITRAMVKMAVK